MKNLCSTCGSIIDNPRSLTCAPCRAWWRYHAAQSPAKFAAYLQRVYRAGHRVSFFTRNNRLTRRAA